MDDAARALERAFHDERSLPALSAYLAALVRCGRGAEVPALMREHARGRLDALGAAIVGEVAGATMAYGFRGEVPTPADFEVRLVAWKLPPDLGGGVLLEVRRARLDLLLEVGPGAMLTVKRTSFGGVRRGIETAFALRLPGGSAIALAELLHDSDDTLDRTDELEAAAKRIADAAGASFGREPDELAFRD